MFEQSIQQLEVRMSKFWMTVLLFWLKSTHLAECSKSHNLTTEVLKFSDLQCYYPNQWVTNGKNGKSVWYGIIPTILKGVENKLPPISLVHGSAREDYPNAYTYTGFMV